jgi:ribulose-phosphate 3-epimerase
MAIIVPAIIAKDEQSIRTTLEGLEFCHEIHIDIVDGEFVESVAWPISPKGTPRDIADVLAPYTIEVDIMARAPERFVAEWHELGAEMIVVHMETVSLETFRTMSKIKNCSIGISASLDTPFAEIQPYLELADYVQVMGIATIGAQGQVFDPRAIDRVKKIAHSYPHLPISIDGSVNATTIPLLRDLPIGRFVVGSAVVGASSMFDAFVQLSDILNHTSEK